MAPNWLRASQIAIDLTVLGCALAMAFVIRFDGDPPIVMTARLALTGPYVVLFEYFVLLASGVHRFSWRYFGLREAVRIALATAAAGAVLVGARFALGHLQYEVVYLRHGVVPYGVIGINAALVFLGLCAVRVVRRLSSENSRATRRRAAIGPGVPTVLIGAGRGGVLVARELKSRPDLGIDTLGFVDDDRRKLGEVVHGLRVLGGVDDLPALARKRRIKQALITISNATGSTIRRMRERCEEAGIEAKMVPGLHQIIGGKVSLSRIRPVAIEDLLRRDPVSLDEDGIRSYIEGRVVMVTGAGGSIGSELCRQICRINPSAVVLVERAENNLFQIHRELAMHFERVVPCVADVRDESRMRSLFAQYRPGVLLHAAAHKHVPMMECNPGEAVKNNLFGTKTVADLAAEHGIEVFVLVSTDKAVNPRSVMGATKRAAELYVQALARSSKTRFVTVRFGNVLDSAGSVVPIFKEQIESGGPLTVTHPEMRRYFMTIPEACQLVLQAASMGNGGEIFVLDMGEPVKIVDLARDLIELSGLRVNEDIEIVFSGTRPGEKLFEELCTSAEQTTKTAHPKIVVANTRSPSLDRLNPHLEALYRRVEQPSDSKATDEALTLLLRKLIPEYEHPTTLPSSQRGDAEHSTRDLEHEVQPLNTQL